MEALNKIATTFTAGAIIADNALKNLENNKRVVNLTPSLRDILRLSIITGFADSMELLDEKQPLNCPGEACDAPDSCSLREACEQKTAPYSAHLAAAREGIAEARALVKRAYDEITVVKRERDRFIDLLTKRDAELAECADVRDSWCEGFTRVRNELMTKNALLERALHVIETAAAEQTESVLEIETLRGQVADMTLERDAAQGQADVNYKRLQNSLGFITNACKVVERTNPMAADIGRAVVRSGGEFKASLGG